MALKSLSKTHYECACEYLSSIPEVDTTLEAIAEEMGDDPDYLPFANRIVNKKSISFRKDDEKYTSLLTNILFHIYLMKKSHEKIYYVTPQLAAKLAQTDLNVDSYFIKSPFREIYIQIDPGLFTITDIQGTYPVRGFYVYLKDDKQTDIKEIRIMASAKLPDTEEIPFNDSLFYYKFHLTKGKVKEQIKSDIEKNVQGKMEEIIRFGGKQNIDHIEEFTYFVFNILLYITSKNPDIREQLPIDFKAKIEGKKSVAKIRKLQKMAGRSTSYPIIIIGDNIKDETNQVEEIRRAGGIGNWKLTKRVHVSGHWRTQWYGGSEAKESKVIFIEPYIKGPELADVINKKYQVGINT
jgi:hypothetical protein